MFVCLSACPSFRVEQLCFHFRFHWNRTRIKGTWNERLWIFMIKSIWILLRIKNAADKNCTEHRNIHFMFNNIFQKSFRLWDNLDNCGTDWQHTEDDIIGRMRAACWINKHVDTHTLRKFNTRCFSTATMATRTRLIVKFTVYLANVQLNFIIQNYKFTWRSVEKLSVLNVRTLRYACIRNSG
jgi:hypothetical protein